MNIGTIGWLVTLCVFGAMGWMAGRRRSRPAGFLTFAILLVVAIVGRGIGTGTRLLDVFGFAVRLNWAIVSCSLGGFLGLLVRNREFRRLRSA